MINQENKIIYQIIIILIFGFQESTIAQCVYDSNFQYIEGQDPSSMSTTLTKPNKGDYYIDPKYGTCVVRLTNNNVEPPVGFARNDYSRRQAFNADNSRILVYSSNGFWHLYNGGNYNYIDILSGFAGPVSGLAGDAEAQWHPTDPNILYFMGNRGGMKIFKVDIKTKVSSLVVDFTGKLPWANAAFCNTGSEGSPSADGRYWGFSVFDNNDKMLGLLVYDMINNQIVGTRNVSIGPNAVSMSPSGRWLTTTGFEGTFAYNQDLTTKKTIFSTIEHSDIALNESGEDIYVRSDYTTGTIIATNLDTDEEWSMYNLYEVTEIPSIHFSGKAFNKPGWILLSTYVGGANWIKHKIMALELKPNPILRNLGHTYSSIDFDDPNNYFSQPHASVNRDFTKIVWNSNWQTGLSSDIDVYLMTLPNEGTLSTDEFKKSNVIAYPNPVTDYLKIIHSIKSFEKYEIFNLTGELIQSDTLGAEESINVSNLSPQIYLLKLFKEGEVLSLKFVKE